MLLADLGAEVIKIERPGLGDPARMMPGFFNSLNRNKKSLTLNLKEPAAREILMRLTEGADVFMEGFRPGAVERLGIDYPKMKKVNPGLIYCSISGYGQEGPYKELPGHDVNYQAMAGMLGCFEDKSGGVITPKLAVGDLSSAMFAALGILTALIARGKTGQGQYIDVSMFDGLVSWMGTQFGEFFETGRTESFFDAGYGTYRAQDGKYLTLGIAYEDWFWERLCKAVGLDDLTSLSVLDRQTISQDLAARLESVFLEKPRDEWIRILEAADVPAAPVKELAEVAEDPHLAFRSMLEEQTLESGQTIRQIGFPIKLSRNPGSIRTPPPELGRHNSQILEALGYSKSEIEAFRKGGVI